MKLTKKELRARERICLALDVPTVSKALELVDELKELIKYFKIGKELHCVAFNEKINLITKINRKGGKIFLDLKFHDTPQTIYQACKAAVIDGVDIIDVHIAGGEEMCKMAIKGVTEKANSLNIERPKVFGVTVLTSIDDQDLRDQDLNTSYEKLVFKRSTLARKWGLDGIICPANKVKEIQCHLDSSFLFITPGIKWGGKYGIGQKQLYSPAEAVKDCSNSILVIGSSITKTENKEETTYEIIKSMSSFV